MPENTTDTQGVSNLQVKCLNFGIFSLINQPDFFTHTIPYEAFKFSMVPQAT